MNWWPIILIVLSWFDAAVSWHVSNPFIGPSTSKWKRIGNKLKLFASNEPQSIIRVVEVINRMAHDQSNLDAKKDFVDQLTKLHCLDANQELVHALSDPLSEALPDILDKSDMTQETIPPKQTAVKITKKGVKTLLEKFRASNENEITFSADLTTEQRACIHKLCRTMKLVSKSTKTGHKEKTLTVSKTAIKAPGPDPIETTRVAATYTPLLTAFKNNYSYHTTTNTNTNANTSNLNLNHTFSSVYFETGDIPSMYLNISLADEVFFRALCAELGFKVKKSRLACPMNMMNLRVRIDQHAASVGETPIFWSPHEEILKRLQDSSFAECEANDNDRDHIAVPVRTHLPKFGLKKRSSRGPNPHKLQKLAAAFSAAQLQRAAHSEYPAIQQRRRKLPASEFEFTVCELLEKNQILLISGETGCGKSTQVPQFLLDHPSIGPTCRIAISQPRRLSAISIAERIAAERCEVTGTTVGYHIRLDTVKSAHTKVLLMTPGVLLRQLTYDPLLREYTHVVIDEAHERDRFTEFLLILLRDICVQRADLKLILMSATMHTEKIRSYFGNIPEISVGASSYPVQEYFLEDVLRLTSPLIMEEEQVKQESEVDEQPAMSPVDNMDDYYCGDADMSDSGSTVLLDDSKVHTIAPTTPDNAQPTTSTHIHTSATPTIHSIPTTTTTTPTTHTIPTTILTNIISTPTPTPTQLTTYEANHDEARIDYAQILALLKHVFSPAFPTRGSVLVFLPGWDDITQLYNMLSFSSEFGDPNKFVLLQLHSGLPKSDQQRVFAPLTRPNQHKIILSTNIAETSITIEDVTVVIDSGRAKETTYDPHTKLGYLHTSWISEAAARQRRGRAGRTRPGACFHLYSAHRAKNLSQFQGSELLRMPLEELVLQAKSLGVAPGAGQDSDGVTSFLLKAMDPPPRLSIENAIGLLQSIGCLDEQEQLTTIGSVVSRLPLNPRISRMFLLGCLLGCGPSALATGACVGYKDPFLMPIGNDDKAMSNRVKAQLGEGVTCDQIIVLRALEGYRELKKQGKRPAQRFCEENMLLLPTLQFLDELAQQLGDIMKEATIDPNSSFASRFEGYQPLLQAIVGMGQYPDLAVRTQGNRDFVTERACAVKLHQSSVNARGAVFQQKCAKPLELVAFQNLVASAAGGGATGAKSSSNNNGCGSSSGGGAQNFLMLGTTPVSVFAHLLTCGTLEEVDGHTKEVDQENNDTDVDMSLSEHVQVVVDGWLVLEMQKEQLLLLTRARKLLNRALESFLQYPTQPVDARTHQGIDRIVEMLGLEQQECDFAF